MNLAPKGEKKRSLAPKRLEVSYLAQNFGKYHSSHALGANALLHWIFPRWYSLFVCRIYEGIHPNYFLISWDTLVRFLLREDGLVTWCFSATVSFIGGIWTEIYVNIMVIFFEGVYVVGVGNEFEQILCHVEPFVSQQMKCPFIKKTWEVFMYFFLWLNGKAF